MVPKIDEEQVPVIALAMDPSRKADRLADVGKAKCGTIVGAIGVHEEIDPSAENVMEKVAPRFTVVKAL
jgi:hypothetical protein